MGLRYRGQRGVALMALLAILIIGASWWLVSALATLQNRTASAREQNARALAEAKQALLGWVARNAADTTDWNPGKLPCPEALGNFEMPPDTANEGKLQGFCAGSSAAVGRLPWKSIGMDKPYDASGEVLWYVVSPGWKRGNNTTPEPALGINSNTLGGLTVDGKANAAVAAIIAPGRPLQNTPLASQTAQGCAAPTNANSRITFPPANSTGYLDCQDIAGASLRTAVADNATHEVFNDQVVLITAAEVMLAIEGAVAARIKASVVPQIQSIYAAASWGTSAANPAFPFAVTYPAAGGFDAAASSYQGVVDKTEGMLPVSAYTCNALTAGRCDSTFVKWKTAPVTISQTGADADYWNSDCTTSTTTSEIVCTINYGKFLCFDLLIINKVCETSGGTVTITATAQNVGMVMRTQAPAVISGIGGATLSAPFITAGADRGGVTATAQGTLPTVTGCTMSVDLFGTYVCVGLGGIDTTQTVRIPITVFGDHPFLNPATTDSWYWFLANNWHQVSYYAVSPAHVPTGGYNCVATANCLTVNVTGGTSLTSKQAIIALAGRSLVGTSGTSRTLADFLDSAENTNGDTVFEQKTITRSSFNDRFAAISP